MILKNITAIPCLKLEFSKICKKSKSDKINVLCVVRVPMEVAHNLEALAMQLSQNGLKEIWSSYQGLAMQCKVLDCL